MESGGSEDEAAEGFSQVKYHPHELYDRFNMGDGGVVGNQ